MENLESLSTRIKTYNRGDRGLDWEIHVRHVRNGLWGVGSYGAHPEFSINMNTAMTLLPEGWTFRVLRKDGEKWTCRIQTDDFKSVTWGKDEMWITDVVSGKQVIFEANTAALAICGAMLEAGGF